MYMYISMESRRGDAAGATFSRVQVGHHLRLRNTFVESVKRLWPQMDSNCVFYELKSFGIVDDRGTQTQVVAAYAHMYKRILICYI